jgi:hypothetical protein
MAQMLKPRTLQLCVIAALFLASAAAVHADTMKQITSGAGQAADDTLAWSQKGADGTVLGASFSATTALSKSVTVGMGAPNSIISVVCTASPCSWTGTGFTAGHSLLWSSDAGNGGSGPVTLSFAQGVAGAGALIQADLPGAFTGQIAVYNGSTLLASYTVASDTAGDPVYLGAFDQTGANINKVVFSLTTCAALCTDFGLDTVNVNTTTTGAGISATPTGLTFASTMVGVTTAAQVVTIKNTGTATLNLTSETITGTNATSFLISANTCGATLAAAATCSVSVEFKPAAAGTLSAALSIASNALGSPQTASLAGLGTVTAATITPTSIAFPAAIVGTTSAAQTVTLKNTGSAALTISSAGLGGTNGSSFAALGNCGSSLAAGASCQYFVAFRPASAAALSGTLSVTDNAAGSPHQVALTGTGTTAPTLKLSATSVAFPTTLHGGLSAAATVTLTNTGTATMNLNSIALGGTGAADFRELSSCGPTLAAAASCNVYVAFKPAAAATYTATVTITDNGTGSPQTITLSGTGN